MRHKYATEAIVLGRAPYGEASATVTLITKELGLVRARAQGVRKPGAKLASALQTFSGSDVVLVRGKEGWRLAGAILAHNYNEALSAGGRTCAGRIAHLMLRTLSGDTSDPEAYALFEELLHILPELSGEEEENVEILAALYLLKSLGLEAGEAIPNADGRYGESAREYAQQNRKDLIVRINRGIEASGL